MFKVKKWFFFFFIYWPLCHSKPILLTFSSETLNKVKVKWHMAKYGDPCSALTHPKCTHPPWTHTRSSGQPFYAVAPEEQLGFQCLAQGHLSRGIKGGESTVHLLPPTKIPAGPETRTRNLLDYESDSLTIRPRLTPWTVMSYTYFIIS